MVPRAGREGGGMNNQLIKCPECGKWYEFYNYSAKNQQMCPMCLRRAEAEAASDDANREMGLPSGFDFGCK